MYVCSPLPRSNFALITCVQYSISMGEAKVKVEALLLVVVMLASFVAPSSSSCIPRRLLMSGYGQQPCKEDRIDRSKPSAANGGNGEPGLPPPTLGPKQPRTPPAPKGGARVGMDPPGNNIPGANN
ncbi:unnamed protein product [Alopecurus aequalis]